MCRSALLALAVAATLGCADGPAAPIVTAADGAQPGSSARAPGDLPTGSMAAQDGVTLLVRIDGCFTHFRYRLTLYPDAEGARLALTELETNLVPGWRLAAPPRVDRATVAGLDALLAAYRDPPRDVICSGQAQVWRTDYRAGEPPRTEYVADSTCAAAEAPGVVTFGTLIDIRRAW